MLFMASSVHPLFLVSLFLLHLPFFSLANLHKASDLFRSELLSPSALSHEASPTVYFEVDRPIKTPRSKPCSLHLLHHDFGFTYGKPPVLAQYSPPSHCSSSDFSKVVLEWKATSKGRQFDRIFGVWLGGVEILRSCSAEPRATGIFWKVEKDITRYSSLLSKNQTLAVFLRNIVDKTYTGVYHVDIWIHFYPVDKRSGSAHGFPANWILPISGNQSSTDGLWFEIKNSTDTEEKNFKIPPNVYKAALEVYVSFHENDEFWYTNPPNDYIVANNLTSTPGNGPFREVLVTLDGDIVGAIWPFTVIYTGGVNPLLWRPITGIGSFNLPSYNIEITPFLGRLLDGKTHTFGFRVTNALNVWYIDANLHLWLDSKLAKTEGGLSSHSVLPLLVHLDSSFKGLDGTFLTSISRSISSAGWVKSSRGNISTHFSQDFSYSNHMIMGNEGNLQIVSQTIQFDDSVSSKNASSSLLLHSIESNKTFQFSLYSNLSDGGNGTSFYVTNLTIGFDEKHKFSSRFHNSTSSLKNLQKAQGYMVVEGNLVTRGMGSTQQSYKYNDRRFCYFRNVSSSNYTILHDQQGNTCGKIKSHGFFGRWPFPTGRAFLQYFNLFSNGGEA